MTTDHTTAKTLAENMMLRAAHQVFTIVGLPVIAGLCAWTLQTVVEANERLAVLETLRPRVDRLEHMADAATPSYPMEDARNLERQVDRLDTRVTLLEKTNQRMSKNDPKLQP